VGGNKVSIDISGLDSSAESATRRDEGLHAQLRMKPKRHEEMKLGSPATKKEWKS
jgi:hypothetical protein